MKSITTFLIAIITLLFLAACGSDSFLSETSPQQDSAEQPATEAPSSNESVVEEPTDTISESGASSNAEIDVAESKPESVNQADQLADPPAETDLAAPDSIETSSMLFDFANGESAWFTVDDNVMGGISQSSAEVDADSGLLTFAGTVSLENNGGFASVRSQWTPYDLGLFDGVTLRVRGDGNIYRLRIYTETTGRDIAYTAIFETEADEWTEVYIPFAKMVPLYRGFVVNSAGPINPEMIRSFGLMIAEKQEGEFKLEVDWIDVISNRQANDQNIREIPL